MNNLTTFNNLKQNLIKEQYNKIYAHELAHKTAGGALAGPIVIENNSDGIPIAGHVTIQMPKLNKNNPQETIDKANIVFKSAMAPSDPSNQDYKVANEAKHIKIQAENLKNSRKIDYYA